jgi:large subunit ribosomal protein L19e
MKITLQRRLAAAVLGCSEKRVWFDEERLSDVKESITKQDIKDLIKEGAIRQKPMKSVSRGRTRASRTKKARGQGSSKGSRKGTKNARRPKKDVWMAKIRVQRKFLKELREKKHVTSSTYQKLYRKAKGGFFRSKRHLKLYAEEHNLFTKKEK